MIYGASGLGKTHLAQAIGNEIRQNLPDKLVIYLSCEKFCQQFVESLKNNTINDFVNFYQAMDVIIMDDIHNFAGKEKLRISSSIFSTIYTNLASRSSSLLISLQKT